MELVKNIFNIGICTGLCVVISFLVLLLIIMGKFAVTVFMAG